MSWFGPDRRQSDRREGERRTPDRADVGRREADRRQVQRRQYFRVVYPPAAAPEIVNIPAQVVDISVKAVRFFPVDSAVPGFNLSHGDKTAMALKFRDGQIVEVSGTV
ncbi:MAG: hypothetical protein PHP01_03875, partial [Phycisphaerae bacterium]|nr:hypothetical protein [Phycisphaerae bacterium]